MKLILSYDENENESVCKNDHTIILNSMWCMFVYNVCVYYIHMFIGSRLFFVSHNAKEHKCFCYWIINDSHWSSRWYQEELGEAVASRSPPHMIRKELVRLMDWKLSRGKFRPRLIQLSESNEESLVKSATEKGIKLAQAGKIEEAIEALGRFMAQISKA